MTELHHSKQIIETPKDPSAELATLVFRSTMQLEKPMGYFELITLQKALREMRTLAANQVADDGDNAHITQCGELERVIELRLQSMAVVE